MSLSAFALVGCEGGSEESEAPRTIIPAPVPVVADSANLTISDGPGYVYTTVGANTAIDKTFTVTNTTNQTATAVVGTKITSPFRFKGGTYPGTGGTCATTLAGGSTCTMVVQFRSSIAATFTQMLTVNYATAGQSKSVARPITATADDFVATISGEPTGISPVINLDITVAGTSVTQYSYKVGEDASIDCSSAAGYSASISTATHITDDISALADGSIELCVLGGTAANVWQDPSRATTATWTKNTVVPTVTIADVTQAEGSGGGSGTFSFAVTTSAVAGNDAILNYTTSNGTATSASGDFTTTSGSLTIAVGQTVATISVPIGRDSLFEADEVFDVILSGGSGYTAIGSTLTAIGTISNDDSAPTLTIADATVTEGNPVGSTSVVVPVTLSVAAGLDITFDYVVVDGTATSASSDFTAASGTATISAGQTSVNLNLSVTRDTQFESDESFTVVISNASSGVPIVDNTSVVSITNDDTAPTVSVANTSVAEGTGVGSSTMNFTVTASHLSAFEITVGFSVSNGTATVADSDFTSTSGTLTIAAGQSTATVPVTISHDGKYELDETLTLTLSGGAGYTVAGSTLSSTGTITNDDAQPTLVLTGGSLNEGNSGTSNLTFTATASAISSQDIVVTVATADATAVASSDFTSVSSSLTIAAGSTTATVDVSVNGETLYESNETFSLTLSGGSGYTAAGSTLTATGTITNDDTAPTISLANLTFAETNAGAVNATMTITSSAVSGVPVIVDFASSNGTATLANSDYSSTTGTATIAAGATTATFDVSVTGDSVYENDETVSLTLSGGSGYTVAGSTLVATLTISNDDTSPTLSISGGSVTEGNSGTTTVSFTVTTSAVSSMDVIFDYNSSNNTATTADSDYGSASGTLTIAAGSTTTTISLTVNGDTKYETDETVTMTLSSGSGYTALGSTLTTTSTITNDDTQPTISIANVTINESNSGTANAVFTVTSSNTSYQDLTVAYATSNGTATTADLDYTSLSGIATISSGSTTASFTVVITGDTKYEPTENYTVTLSGGANYNSVGSTLTATGTITNDDSAPTISIANLAVAEGNSGTTDAVFVITASEASGINAIVSYATSNSTATTADSDYTSTSGTATLVAGDNSVSLTIPVLGDSKYETNETYTVTLSGGSGYTVAGSTLTATGTITNDDTAPTVSIDSISLNEGNSGTSVATFTVTAAALTGTNLIVAYSTSDGTATTADSDYQSASGTLTLSPGSTTATIDVTVNGDGKFETDETVQMTLSGGSGYTALGSTLVGTLTMNNDDAQPTLSIADVTTTEPNSGTTNAVYTVTASGTSYLPITVAYSTSDGTATVADTDYNSLSGTATIAAGSTTASLTVAIRGDTKYEPNESYTLTLSGGTNYSAAGSTLTATGTITNNDPIPTIAIPAVSTTEGNSGTTNAVLTITRSAVSGVDIIFDYTTSDITATTADNDYSAISGTATIPAGGTDVSLTITITGDTKYEASETFRLTLSGGSGYNPVGSVLTRSSSITNDDGMPSLSIDDINITEGNSGTVTGSFTVTLSSTSSVATTFSRISTNGTATIADSDYVAVASSAMTIPAGSTSLTIDVTVNGDTKYENSETINLTLSGAANATIADNVGIATIVNDDTQPTLSVAAVSKAEGNSGTSNATFTVTASNKSFQSVTVAYTTSNGTATVAGSDYNAASGTATITAGSTTATVNVAVRGDATYESNETFTLTLSGGANYTAAGSTLSAIGTITNDDAGPTPTLSPAVVTVMPSNNFTFSSSGGLAPYVYSVTAGVGSIDSATGVYSSAVAGSATITVTDAANMTATSEVNVTNSTVLRNAFSAQAPSGGTATIFHDNGGVGNTIVVRNGSGLDCAGTSCWQLNFSNTPKTTWLTGTAQTGAIDLRDSVITNLDYSWGAQQDVSSNVHAWGATTNADHYYTQRSITRDVGGDITDAPLAISPYIIYALATSGFSGASGQMKIVDRGDGTQVLAVVGPSYDNTSALGSQFDHTFFKCSDSLSPSDVSHWGARGSCTGGSTSTADLLFSQSGSAGAPQNATLGQVPGAGTSAKGLVAVSVLQRDSSVVCARAPHSGTVHWNAWSDCASAVISAGNATKPGAISLITDTSANRLVLVAYDASVGLKAFEWTTNATAFSALSTVTTDSVESASVGFNDVSGAIVAVYIKTLDNLPYYKVLSAGSWSTEYGPIGENSYQWQSVSIGAKIVNSILPVFMYESTGDSARYLDLKH